MELLRLSHQTMHDGVLYFKEFAFCSDHMVFTRTSSMADEECGWFTSGWKFVARPDGQPATWCEESELVKLADKMGSKGWQVQWNPAANPGLSEFRREVKL